MGGELRPGQAGLHRLAGNINSSHSGRVLFSNQQRVRKEIGDYEWTWKWPRKWREGSSFGSTSLSAHFHPLKFQKIIHFFFMFP